MKPLRKEASVVRFAPAVMKQLTQLESKLPNLSHLYRPEFQRQATEKVQSSNLGEELEKASEHGLGEALNHNQRVKAQQEILDLLKKVG